MRYLISLLILIAISWRLGGFLSYQFVGQLGFEIKNNMVFNLQKASTSDKVGLLEGDSLIAFSGLKSIDDKPVIGSELEIEVIRNGLTHNFSFRASSYPSDQIAIMNLMGAMGIIFLGIGVYTYMKSKEKTSLLFMFYCIVMSIHWGYVPLVPSSTLGDYLMIFYVFVSIYSTSLLLHVVLLFPQEYPTSRLWLIYFPGLLAFPLAIMSLWQTDLIQLFHLVEFLLTSIYSIIIIILLFNKIFKSEDQAKAKLKIMLVGSASAIVLYIISSTVPAFDFGGTIGTQPWSLLFLAIPISFSYAIISSKNEVNSKLVSTR